MNFTLDLKGVDLEEAKKHNTRTITLRGCLYLTDEDSYKIEIEATSDLERSISPPTERGWSSDTSLPSDCPIDEDITLMRKAYPIVDIEQQILLFQDYYRDKLRTNWREVWKRWCSRAQKDYKENTNAESSSGGDPFASAAETLRQTKRETP